MDFISIAAACRKYTWLTADSLRQAIADRLVSGDEKSVRDDAALQRYAVRMGNAARKAVAVAVLAVVAMPADAAEKECNPPLKASPVTVRAMCGDPIRAAHGKPTLFGPAGQVIEHGEQTSEYIYEKVIVRFYRGEVIAVEKME